MNILHLTPYYTPAYAFGGVVRAVEGMTLALIRRGHSITVLTTDVLNQTERLPDPMEEMISGVRVIRTPNVSQRLRGRYNLSTPNKMQAIAKTLLPDVDLLHIHEFRTVENLLVTPIAAEQNIPMILSPHGTLNQSTGRSGLKKIWDKLLSPAVAQRIDHVVALAQQEQDDVQAIWQNFGRRRIPTQFSIIPNGVDLPNDNPRIDLSDFKARFNLADEQIVLFMGRLHQRKGVDILLRAFQVANLPNTKLLIVGPDEGMLSTLESLADDRVMITGYLEGNDIEVAYALADLLVLPAIGEGLSMAVLEAMSHAIPVILSPGCNFPQAAEADAGWIVEPEVDVLADALKSAFADGDALREKGINARKLIETNYTWDIVAEQLETVYQRYVK